MARNSDAITAELRRRIMGGELPVGAKLPNEREMCAEFSVSRPTLREAVRALEAAGLVNVQIGPGGGIFVAEPNGDRIADALEHLLVLQGPTTIELEEFRLSFEPQTAYWAAVRATADDISALHRLTQDYRREALKKGASWERLVEIDMAIHTRIALAARNYIRSAIMRAIYRATRDFALAQGSRVDDEMRADVAAELVELAEAVRGNDGEAARRLMESHIRRFAPALASGQLGQT